MDLRIGTAAWALPRDVRESFPAGESNLARYGQCFGATEINSSFYRPHRQATYARWAASVPPDFRFAVKLPKAITHEARLVGCEAALARFAEETQGLGTKRGPILIQLPPKLAFDDAVARHFFGQFGDIVGGAAALEPRHASWFSPEAEALMLAHRIARVAADPAPVPGPDAAQPGGWPGLIYARLHGSPRIYWSSYDGDALLRWKQRLDRADAERWVIFDNTASGAATADALAFARL